MTEIALPEIPTFESLYVDPYPGRKGSERVFFECGRCGGSGSVSWGADVSGSVIRDGREVVVPKVCFDCNGTGRDSVLVSSARGTARRRARATIDNVIAQRAYLVRSAEIEARYAETLAILDAYADRSSFVGRIAEAIRQEDASEEQISKAIEVAGKIKADDEAPKVAVPAGRREIEGEILTVRTSWSDYGMSVKMLLGADGFKVWGSVPKGVRTEAGVEYVEDEDEIRRALRGRRIAFTATLEPKEGEDGFGFFSRPTKARFVE